jgi:hypothetical protein
MAAITRVGGSPAAVDWQDHARDRTRQRAHQEDDRTRDAMCTVAPLASSSRQQAAPIPDEPPVTTATVPSSPPITDAIISQMDSVVLFWHPA